MTAAVTLHRRKKMVKTYFCFVCLSFLLIGTDFVRGESDYVFNLKAGGWLKLHTMPAAWEEAYVTCHNEGAVLASPLNKQLGDALRLQIIQRVVNGKIFLGTHDLNSKGNFVSVEGVPLSDMNLKWGPIDARADIKDCLSMTVDGSVYISPCEHPLLYICYRKFDSQTMNECGTFDNGYQLNQQTGSCYKIHARNVTWTRAYSICASEGSHLVIINDANEFNIVKNLFPATTSFDPWQGFHVGVRAWGRERIWTTIHGEKIGNVYNNRCPGEPNNKSGQQNRAAYLWMGYLDDLEADRETREFACEKSPYSLENY